MKLFKKIVMSLVLAMIPLSFASADKSIYVNNYKLKDTTPIIIKDERSYISAKDLSNALGGVYTYDSKTKTGTIKVDSKTYAFTSESNLVNLNGSKLSTEFRPFVDNNKLMIPLAMVKSFLTLDISWNYKTQNLLINSDEKTKLDQPKYNNKTTLELLKKSMGEESENFTFTYAQLVEDVKNEKFMVDGTYFVFKSNEKGVVSNNVRGFFYLNVYTNDVYYYPLEASSKSDVIKYSNGQEVKDYVANGRNNTVQLIATTKMISDIKKSETSLGEFTYTRKASIDKKYLAELPEANYYFYQASKMENGKAKPQFEVAQNTRTLEVYLFLKGEKGVNIIKLPDKTIIKTIAKAGTTTVAK